MHVNRVGFFVSFARREMENVRPNCCIKENNDLDDDDDDAGDNDMPQICAS